MEKKRLSKKFVYEEKLPVGEEIDEPCEEEFSPRAESTSILAQPRGEKEKNPVPLNDEEEVHPLQVMHFSILMFKFLCATLIMTANGPSKNNCQNRSARNVDRQPAFSDMLNLHFKILSNYILFLFQNVKVSHATPSSLNVLPRPIVGTPAYGPDGVVLKTSVCDEIEESVRRAEQIEIDLANVKVIMQIFHIT